jgi:hypothetical protein
MQLIGFIALRDSSLKWLGSTMPSTTVELREDCPKRRRPEPRAVSEILCPVKAAFRVVAPWGRDDLTALNADTQFPKPL